jgi:hypothetical protein
MAIVVSTGHKVAIEFNTDDTFYVLSNDGQSASGPFPVSDPRFVILQD